MTIKPGSQPVPEGSYLYLPLAFCLFFTAGLAVGFLFNFILSHVSIYLQIVASAVIGSVIFGLVHPFKWTKHIDAIAIAGMVGGAILMIVIRML